MLLGLSHVIFVFFWSAVERRVLTSHVLRQLLLLGWLTTRRIGRHHGGRHARCHLRFLMIPHRMVVGHVRLVEVSRMVRMHSLGGFRCRWVASIPIECLKTLRELHWIVIMVLSFWAGWVVVQDELESRFGFLHWRSLLDRR